MGSHAAPSPEMAVSVKTYRSRTRPAFFRRPMEAINTEHDMLQRAALGRNMHLGMLYDCRNDSLVPGLTLWNQDVLKNNIRVHQKTSLYADLRESNTLTEKEAALDIEAALKASFSSGLVDFAMGGSAKFLYHKNSSNEKVSVILHYKSTSRFEQLAMDHLAKQKVQHPDVLDKGVATHVITGVEYGAHAFLVFEKDHESEKDIKELKAEMKATISKLAAEGRTKMVNKDREFVKNIHVAFYGDIELGKNPTTFQQAMQLCRELPSKLSKNPQNAVPMRVWLFPLGVLDSRTPTLVCEIKEELISQYQNITEGLGDLELKCDNLMDLDVCDDFPQFKETCMSFKEQIKRYRGTFLSRFKRLLLAVRGGDCKEQELADFLSDSEKSPFALKKLHGWIKNEELEMATTAAYLKQLDGIEIIKSETDLLELYMNPQVKNVVCFVLPIAKKEEYIEVLSRYLKSLTGLSAANLSNPSERLAFENSFEGMTLTARKFSDFYHDNKDIDCSETVFAVTGFTDEGVPGSIMLWEGGTLKTESFEPPEKPEKPVARGKNGDDVTLEWQAPKEHFLKVLHYRVRYRETKSSGETSDWEVAPKTTMDPLPADKTRCTIQNLDYYTTYEFQVLAFYRIGVTVSQSIKTSTNGCSIQ